MQILAVPRGAKVSIKDGSITIDGEATELRPVEPFTGTAPLSALTDQREYRREPEPEHERFDVAEAEPPQNILVLNPHGRRQRDDDTDDPGPGAA